MKFKKSWAAAAAMFALSGAAQAALVDRGGGMIYDTTRNITWLADMTFSGSRNWSDANTWANNLVYGGFSDWRLPTLIKSDSTCTYAYGPGTGFNCTGGELSGLFVTDLGNKAGESVLNQTGDTAEQIANQALFSNLRDAIYWSDQVTTPLPNPYGAYIFGANKGLQAVTLASDFLFALPVHPGDVAAPIPEPQAWAMLMLGLCVVTVALRRRPR